MDLLVSRVAVVLPAGGHQEVHDVQTESNVAGPGPLVEEGARRHATDVALRVDLGDELVGLDFQSVLDLADGRLRRKGGTGAEEGREEELDRHGSPSEKVEDRIVFGEEVI